VIRLLFCILLSACATQHGTLSALSESKNPDDRCPHHIPRDVCARCHPELVAKFRAAGDWCAEHGVPESQCLICHPDLSFTPLAIPPGADYQRLSHAGEDVPSLEAHAVAGKVTIFDFYADWCAPCRQLDEHVLALMKERSDLVYRRLNLGGWETPLAKHYLAHVSSVPFVVVYDKRGQRLRELVGLDLAKLDQAIADGAR
jgi:thiol-disulfide isomerase/thioredoxin